MFLRFNSLWPSNTICRLKSGSVLASTMPCGLATARHCLNRCWVVTDRGCYEHCIHLSTISHVLMNLTRNTFSEIKLLKLLPHLPGTNELNVNFSTCADGRNIEKIWNDIFNYLVLPYGDRSGSTVVKIVACCLSVPSHYLNQCWLIINAVVHYVR